MFSGGKSFWPCKLENIRIRPGIVCHRLPLPWKKLKCCKKLKKTFYHSPEAGGSWQFLPASFLYLAQTLNSFWRFLFFVFSLGNFFFGNKAGHSILLKKKPLLCDFLRQSNPATHWIHDFDSSQLRDIARICLFRNHFLFSCGVKQSTNPKKTNIWTDANLYYTKEPETTPFLPLSYQKNGFLSQWSFLPLERPFITIND